MTSDPSIIGSTFISELKLTESNLARGSLFVDGIVSNPKGFSYGSRG